MMNPNLPVRYGAAFNSNANNTANTPQTVVAAASNVNGLIVWDASFSSRGTGQQVTAFLAKTSAPVGVTDGDVICGEDSTSVIGTDVLCAGRLRTPVFIAAGKGLYYIPTITETSNNQRSVLYTIL